MFSSKTILITALAAIGSANAISSGCGTTVAALAFGDLGGCLQLTSALSLLRGDSGNFTGTLDNYLNSLCASSTPRCSNATLTDAQTRITSGCSEDLQNGGTDGATVQGVQAILTNYDEAIAAACSRNSTTGDFCVSSTLETIQTVSGTSISFDFLTGLISGSSDSTALQTAFQSGQLCTGCVQEIYYQARQANASIATSSVGSAVSGACGANFGASAPSGVQAGTSPSQSSAQASTSPSGAASRVASLSLNAPLAVGGVAAMFGVVVGGLAIF